MNSLFTSISPVINEINITDFIRLELLQVKYPKIYDDIARNPHIYLGRWSYLSFPSLKYASDKERFDGIKKHISLITSGYSSSKIETIRNILSDLFWEVKNAIGVGPNTDNTSLFEKFLIEKRISHPQCFPTYFTRQIRSNELSFELIENTIYKLNRLSKDKTGNFLEKIINDLRLRKQSVKAFLNFLRIEQTRLNQKARLNLSIEIAKLIFTLNKESTWDSEFDSAYSLIFTLLNNLDQKNISPTLKSIIKINTDLRFLCQIPLALDPSRGGDLHRLYGNVNRDKIIKIIDKILNKTFIENKATRFFETIERDGDWTFISYQWETQWGKNPEGDKIVIDYILNEAYKSKKIIEFIKKRMRSTDLLTNKMKFKFRDYNDKHIQKIIESIKGLLKDKSKSMNKKTREFINKCVKAFKERPNKGKETS